MARAKLRSIGRLLPTLEARIIDAEGNDVAESEPGEMALRGPTIMRYVIQERRTCSKSTEALYGLRLDSGYWRNEQATMDTFTADGWYRTGDVAKVDGEGYW